MQWKAMLTVLALPSVWNTGERGASQADCFTCAGAPGE